MEGIILSQEGWSYSHKGIDLFHLGSQVGTKGMVVKGESIYFQVINKEVRDGLCKITYRHRHWIMVDILTMRNQMLHIKRKWTNGGEVRECFKALIECVTDFKPSYYLIPAVSYNGNPWGNGNEPKGLLKEGVPWVFSYSRTTLPAASFSQNEEVCFGLMSDYRDDSLYNCSLSLNKESEGYMTHQLIWPENEGPYTYSSRDQYKKAIDRELELEPSQSFTAECLLYINNDVNDAHTGWTRAYDLFLDMYSQDVPRIMGAKEVWDDGIYFTKEVLYKEEMGKAFFERGLHPNEEGVLQFRPTQRIEMGWTGQHGVFSYALINDYIINGNNDSLEKGLKVLDTWVKEAPVHNGLFYSCYDKSFTLDEAYEEADTCNLAWGGWQLIEAYKKVQELGIERKSWLDMAIGLCDFFVKHYSNEFSFGKSWHVPTGEVRQTGGTIGIFMCIPLVEAYKLTHKEDYLKCAITAYKAYATRDLDQMTCTAGALDTTCVDKETCWPFLKVGIDLYEITGENYYKDEAIKAAYYLLSWMYHYNIQPQEIDNDFNVYGYSTYGGTSVSAQHHHLDPWGALIAMDWLRLADVTGDERWSKRAQATWTNALHGISDGETPIHGIVRPRGSQNEAFFHTNWFFHGADGVRRFNDWLVAWPAAFRLCTLLHTEKWEIFDKKQ